MRLRPFPFMRFDGEGAVVEVETRIVRGKAVALVELATTFAPGDNFRVLAACERPILSGLNDLNSVSTNGPVAALNGLAAAQLSVWRRVHIEQDCMADTPGDMQAGRLTATVAGPGAGQFIVIVNINIAAANQYEHGILRTAGTNYPIVSNTAGAGALLVVTAAAAPAIGPVEIFEDDWEAAGNAAPTTRVNTQDDANLYDMLSESNRRDLNRFADAYIQPALTTLDAFDSADVPGITHVVSTNADILAAADAYRGQRPLGTPRPANYETDVFWVVYVCTGFEAAKTEDNDPVTEDGIRGLTAGTGEISLVFLETTRDTQATENPPNAPTVADVRARVTVHEMGHQFRLASGQGTQGRHRDDGMNIMNSIVDCLQAADTFFNPNEVATMRTRHLSP